MLSNLTTLESGLSANPQIRSRGGKTIASFDVFDTLLTRIVGRPASLFLWLGHRLAAAGKLQCSAEAFAAARVDAERRACRNAPGNQATLAEIYAELAWSLGMDAKRRDEMMGAELQLEEECIRVVPGAVERVAEARTAGAKVFFLSDMYLPKSFIIAELSKHGLWSDDDQCFVSGECRRSKRTGELFDHLLAHEDIPATSVAHCGNDAIADLAAPCARGIQIVPILHANLNRYEEILESHARDTQGLSSALAGASRLARLQVPTNDEHLGALRDISAGVAAPVLTAYVLWILHKARQEGLARLYFVSRDGQILCDIARRLSPKIGFRGECRYLYGGRQAWFLAASASDMSRWEEWCFEESEFLSVSSQLTRAGLKPEQWREALEGLGFSAATFSANLSPPDRDRLRQWLRSAPIAEKITEEAFLRRGVLKKYLAQELVLGSTRWGLVDVGWRGRLQYYLEQVLADEGAQPPTGFYFGLSARSRYASKGPQHCYFFDDDRQVGYGNDLRFLATPIEIFCAANHGVVMGYQERQGVIHPVLREECNSSAMSWGLETVHRTIGQFVDCLHLDPSLVNERADLRPCTSSLLKCFWKTPLLSEAVAWGRHQFEADQAGAYQLPLASPYSLKDVWDTYRRGGNPRRNDCEWKPGSMAMTHPVVRKLIGVAGRAARALGGGQK
jgi:FMN phosphatase YigB (HAD superfamily)